jgi:hypothetical protein
MSNRNSTVTLQLAIALAATMIVTAPSFSQSVRYAVASRYSGMGAYSMNFVDPLSVLSNQAALANIRSMSAGIYGEKRFLLEELGLYSLSLCLPLSFGGVGLSARYFGHQDFNETQVGIAYGKSLGKIDIGIQINLHALKLSGYGVGMLVNFEAGAIFHISKQLHAGFHLYNPTGSKFGKDHSEKLSSAYSSGFGYEASDKLFVTAQIIKEEDKPVHINAGLQYVFEKKVFARVGLETEATHLYFGFGLKWNVYRIDVTASYHPQLGFTPGLLLVFEGKRKDE